MDWDMYDETLFANGGERLTITLDVAALVPGTYVYLDTDDETIMRGALAADDEDEDEARGVPPARIDFGDEDDTDPDGRTIIGPLLSPGGPASATIAPARTATLKGPAVEARRPVPTPDQIRNEIDDDDDIGGHTIMGPLMTPRRPAPIRK